LEIALEILAKQFRPSVFHTSHLFYEVRVLIAILCHRAGEENTKLKRACYSVERIIEIPLSEIDYNLDYGRYREFKGLRMLVQFTEDLVSKYVPRLRSFTIAVENNRKEWLRLCPEVDILLKELQSIKE
jgi:hypothetical protein